MNHLLSQVSYPVFLYLTFLFFLMGSIFSFLVGIALIARSDKAFRFFTAMNRWVSVRQMMRPLSVPHYIEHKHRGRRIWLGIAIAVGAVIAIYLLRDADLQPTLLLFDDSLTAPERAGVAENLKDFLLAGNAACLVVSLLILLFPGVLSVMERYTDRMYSLRKRTKALGEMHMEVDCWVLKHPTSAGITLVLLSLSAGMLMLSYMQSVVA